VEKYKIGKIEIVLLSVSLGCLLIASCFQAYVNYQKSMVRRHATALAETLDVDIQKYNPDAFPIDYFRSALTPGMPVDKVHQIVRGYEMSLVCPQTNSEVYYFYSIDKKGVKIKLSYDLNKNTFLDISADDNSSVLINTSGCISGLIGE